MGRRARNADEFEVKGVVERLAPYDVALADGVSCPEAVDDDLVERAAALLQLMPGNQRRETIEDLVSPNDQQRGREAVDALIESAFAAEDEVGRLRRVCPCAGERGPATEPTGAPLRSAVEEEPSEQEPTDTWLRRASGLARRVAASASRSRRASAG